MAVLLFKPLFYGHLFLLQRSGNTPRNVAAYRNFHYEVKKTKSTKVCFRSHQEGAHQTRAVENFLSMMFCVSGCLFSHVRQNKICNILLSFLSICCLVRVKCTIDKTSVFFMSAESHGWTISSRWGAGERKSNDFCVWSGHWGSSHCAGQLTNPLRPLNLGP